MLKNCVLLTMSALTTEDTLREGAPEMIRYMLENDYRFFILTENSSRSAEEIAHHLRNQGLQGITSDHIYTSTMAAAERIMLKDSKHNRANYIGGSGIREVLYNLNFKIDEDADWVFVGSDRNSTYSDYSGILKSILGGARIIATDLTRLEYTRNGVYPGPGAIVKMLEHASGTKAVMMCFPSPLFITQAMWKLNALAEDTIFISDQLEREILCAQKCHVTTAYIAGDNDEAGDLFDQEIHPDLVIQDLRAFTDRR